MNQPRAKTNVQKLSRSILKTPVLLAISLTLASMFWTASLPIARAAAVVTPAEMIQAQLPHATSLASAPKAAVLSAVCKAITKSQKDAPDIVRTAAGARREFTADILKTAVHCIHSDKVDPNCELGRSILHEAIAADPDQAASLTETFVGLMPNCLESPEEGPNGSFGAANIGGAPGSVGGGGGGGGAASGDVCSVCHNNQQISVACSDLNSYLRNHPGDTAGACQASPTANR